MVAQLRTPGSPALIGERSVAPMENMHTRAHALMLLAASELGQRIRNSARGTPTAELQAEMEVLGNEAGMARVGQLAGRLGKFMLHLMALPQAGFVLLTRDRPPLGYMIAETAKGIGWGMEGDSEPQVCRDRETALVACWFHAIVHTDPPGFSTLGGQVMQWQPDLVAREFAVCENQIDARRVAWAAHDARTLPGMPFPDALAWSDEQVAAWKAERDAVDDAAMASMSSTVDELLAAGTDVQTPDRPGYRAGDPIRHVRDKALLGHVYVDNGGPLIKVMWEGDTLESEIDALAVEPRGEVIDAEFEEVDGPQTVTIGGSDDPLVTTAGGLRVVKSFAEQFDIPLDEGGPSTFAGGEALTIESGPYEKMLPFTVPPTIEASATPFCSVIDRDGGVLLRNERGYCWMLVGGIYIEGGGATWWAKGPAALLAENLTPEEMRTVGQMEPEAARVWCAERRHKLESVSGVAEAVAAGDAATA